MSVWELKLDLVKVNKCLHKGKPKAEVELCNVIVKRENKGGNQ